MSGSLRRFERPEFNALVARWLREAVDGVAPTVSLLAAVERGLVAPESIALLAAVGSAVPSPEVRARVAAAVNAAALTLIEGGAGATRWGRRGVGWARRVLR